MSRRANFDEARERVARAGLRAEAIVDALDWRVGIAPEGRDYLRWLVRRGVSAGGQLIDRLEEAANRLAGPFEEP